MSFLPRLAGFPLGLQGGLDALGEFLRLFLAPVVSEVECRFFADHVVVQRDDVDAVFPQCLEHRLDFRACHDEIAIHDSGVVAAGEGRRRAQAH